MPLVPAGSLAVLIDSEADMVMLSDLVTVVRLASFICTVKVLAPAVVGVPEMIPVEAARVRPAGRVPEAIDQVYGVWPPVAARVWL